MRTIELWRYSHQDTITGKRITTRYVLTDEEARDRLVDPQRVAGSRELRTVPEARAEWDMTGAFRNQPGSPDEKKPPTR